MPLSFSIRRELDSPTPIHDRAIYAARVGGPGGHRGGRGADAGVHALALRHRCSWDGDRLGDTRPSDILITVSAVASVLLLAIESMLCPSRTLLLAVICLSFLSLGLAWPDLLGLPLGWGAGAVLTLLAGLAACAGALWALAEPLARAPFRLKAR
jgi:hypothetical protein